MLLQVMKGYQCVELRSVPLFLESLPWPICGRCGLRMTSAYNNNGHTARYLCGTMKSVYDAPLCQSLTAAPLDALIARLVLEAVRPAALEVSLAVATDLEAERAALERHWAQRLERAR